MKNKKIDRKIRKISGVVVSDKMDKTVVVKVERLKTHPVYKKRYKVSRKYKAHDPENQFKVGDQVIIAETKPLSRDKKWAVLPQKEDKK